MDDPVRAILDDKGRQVHTVPPETTVAAAVAAMNRARIGALVVVEAERPLGIFTERDVLVRVVDGGRDPAATQVGEVMTAPVVAIDPRTTVGEAMVLVTEKRCRHLPVLEEGRLAGMISIGDLTRWLVRGQQHRIDELLSYITGGYPA